ncbi:hypothetical protein GCM10010988_38990 [Cnuibacter physcomitrellae]|nr:hypothetical protein GCM10010988_38990 [Cnuibacter physcomitrellae]
MSINDGHNTLPSFQFAVATVPAFGGPVEASVAAVPRPAKLAFVVLALVAEPAGADVHAIEPPFPTAYGWTTQAVVDAIARGKIAGAIDVIVNGDSAHAAMGDKNAYWLMGVGARHRDSEGRTRRPAAPR